MIRFTVVLALVVFAAMAATAQSKWEMGRPIVTYYAGPEMTEATAKQMAEGNFNVVWCRAQELDTVQKQGLRGMLRDPLLAPATLNDPAKRAQLDALIAEIKTHPALYAYYLIDEPAASRFPEFGKLVAYLREKDLGRMCYINLFPTYATNEQLGNKGDVVTAYREHLQQFVDIVKPDLISYDHYHFTMKGDASQYFLNLALVREAALKAKIPFLNIVPACTWTPGMRIPSTAEVRWLVNTSIAYGAEGISYYVYFYPRNHLGMIANADGTPTPLYHGLKTINRDFESIVTQLQPLQSLGAYHHGSLPTGAQTVAADAPFRLEGLLPPSPPKPMDPEVGFVLGYFGPQAGQPTHVVVVNLDYSAPAETTLVAPGNLQTYNPATRRWTSTGKSKLPLRLQAGGVELVRLAQ
ncbi:MAG: hypothetical protein ACYC63_07680 [Armatimonadota bacterium]